MYTLMHTVMTAGARERSELVAVCEASAASEQEQTEGGRGRTK